MSVLQSTDRRGSSLSRSPSSATSEPPYHAMSTMDDSSERSITKKIDIETVSCVELPERTPGTTGFQPSPYMTHVAPPRRVSDNAREGIAKERRMSFASGCRMYPRAILWSVILSLTIVMIAYDKMMVGGSYGSPSFQKQFGDYIGTNDKGQEKYDLSSTWQSALGNAATAIETLALLANGYLTDKFGYKKIVVGALVTMNCVTFVTFFSRTREVLLVSQMLSGIPWGLFQTLSATYAAEVLPVALRTYLLANVNMCWLIGQVVATGVLNACADFGNMWAWRLPFGLQWAWSLPLLLIILWCPEAPWWLVRHGRDQEAHRALERLTEKGRSSLDIDQVVSVMKYTDHIEKQLNAGEGTSYLDCFRGTNLRRTEIASMAWITQAWCGGTLMGYANYFYLQAGFPVEHSFKLTTGMFALGIVGNMAAWLLLRQFGRRTLYLCGEVGMIAILLLGGLVSVIPAINPLVVYWILGSLLLVFTLIYNLTIGPTCYVLVAEIPSTRLRVKTVVLARVFYNIASILNNVLIPRMLNPTAWNLKGNTCWPLAGMAIMCLIWIWYRLPETKGLTYIELDILFDKKAPTPKFRQFRVNLESRGYLSLNKVEQSGSRWHGWQGYS